jgi:Tc5 transposase DNA-binding domain/DDE superfamily endonuclease
MYPSIRKEKFLSHMKKLTRINLTFEEKKQIFDYKIQHSEYSYESVGCFFSNKFKKTVTARAVSAVMKSFKVGAKINLNMKKNKPVKHQDLEYALVSWVDLMISRNFPVSDVLIQKQALKFAAKLMISDFKASNGWLDKFKKRHVLSSYAYVGETAHVDLEIIDYERERIAKELKEFNLSDIYNMDETGLYFRGSLARSISNKPMKGRKPEKERITVMLCCNADGTDKRKPIVIGKSKSPRCFKNFNVNLFVNYRSNDNAWTTSHEFFQTI